MHEVAGEGLHGEAGAVAAGAGALPLVAGHALEPARDGEGRLAQRRRDLEGFVSAAFRPDLMLQILFASPLAEPVDLEIYDGIDRRSEQLLYDRDRRDDNGRMVATVVGGVVGAVLGSSISGWMIDRYFTGDDTGNPGVVVASVVPGSPAISCCAS